MKKMIPVILILLCMLMEGCKGSEQPSVLHIAMPYSDHVQDPDSNYYINVLKEETGMDLDITLIRQTDGVEYLSELAASDADVDIVMFGEGLTITEEELGPFIDTGVIYSDDGDGIYTNYGTSIREGAGQILWINYEWLTQLGLNMPTTTEELRDVLTAFKTKDPNGNGLADEIPLVGCQSDYIYSPVEFLLQSYIYNDPYHSRYGVNDEVDTLKAIDEDFREGLKFCNELYEEGLLDKRTYTYDLSELKELVNSPDDMVGAFTTGSISDIIYQGNPEIMARFMHVTPLTGPEGMTGAMYSVREPLVGAVITGQCKNKDDAVRLLETMLGEEESLIARFGEKGVDWEFSDGGDVSIYGNGATIVTKNYIWNTSQNKHLNGIGPMYVPDKYIEGVTWNGINSDAEYIDGRAQMTYKSYLPQVTALHDRDEALSRYMDDHIEEFVTGDKDIRDDIVWDSYVRGIVMK